MKNRNLTTKDLTKKYDKTIVTIYNWVKAGIPCEKIFDGRKEIYVFDEKEVEEWLKNNSRT